MGSTGAAVSVLHQEWDPNLIGSLVVWLDASDTSTIAETGGLVNSWTDKSSNAHVFTQSYTANKPTLVASGGSLSAQHVRWGTGGGFHKLSAPSVGFTGNDGGYEASHMLAVLSWDTGGTDYAVLMRSPVPPYVTAAILHDTYGVAGYEGGWTNTDGALVAKNTKVLISLSVSSAGMTARINGAQDGLVDSTTTPVTSGTNTLELGAQDAGKWTNLEIGELIHCDQPLSAGDLSTLESYLNQKWSIW
jgi:hypothetical protein